VRQWEWNFGFGNDSVFTTAPFGVVYNQAGVYNVRLTVVDSLGCRYTLTRPAAVEVHQSTAGFIASDTLVCLNTPIQFSSQSQSSNGSTASLSHVWNFGNGQNSNLLNPSVNYAAEGTYDVSLAVTDQYGCADTLVRPQYITVANARAQFSMSDSFSTCPPLLVVFTNSSINNRQSFWDFGNGNNSIVVSPAHTFTTPGIFNVKLRVVGNGGCVDSLTRRVEIRGPQGTFTYGPLIGCPPLGVNFSATTINTRFYTWDYSDGTSDITGSNTATHNYITPGSYVPRLILEDGLGCKVPVQGLDTIRVLGARALIQSVQQNAFCDSATVAFTDSSITNDVVIRYRWRFGDGAESALRNPTHTYRTPGVYQVTFEVWTINNCYAADTLNVPVIISASPQLSYSYPPAVCVPAMVQFTGQWLNQDTTQMSYQWTFGNGAVSNQLVPNLVSYTLPGLYNVQLIGVNRYGCTDTVLQQIMVNDTPRVVTSPDLYICLGTPQALNASGALSYVWDAHPSLSCTNCASPFVNPSANRIYRVTGTDINGCQASDTALVRVKLPGNLTVGLGDTICVGESVQLRSQGFELLRWSPAVSLNNAAIANPIARPATTTRYRVTGTDSLGCFEDSAFVSVVVYPIPQFNIVESSIRTTAGSVVPLRTQSSPDIIRWSWSPAQGLSCLTCPEPNATVSRRVTYTATVTNAGGCVSQDTVFVEPYCTGDNVFLPNTFSPNGDGQNDVFYPRGNGVINIKSMIIFNRWGEVMYERKNFALNDPTAGWNGTYKGVALTPDVYVYVVEVQCGNNEVFGLKGNVTLLK
jgi:gliding motility-associated-like protein